jgi:hypothetical protein
MPESACACVSAFRHRVYAPTELEGDVAVAAAGVNFNQTAAFGAPPDAVIQALVAGTMGQAEYTTMVVGPGTVVLTRKYRPTWALVVFIVGLVLFLAGLLALLVTNTETLTINVLPVEGGGSRVTVSGVGSLPMLHQVAAILNAMPDLAAPGPGGHRVPEAKSPLDTVAYTEIPGLTDTRAEGGDTVEPTAGAGISATRDTYEPGWYPDPRGRYERRYYDGHQWTTNVLNGAVPAIDEL